MDTLNIKKLKTYIDIRISEEELATILCAIGNESYSDILNASRDYDWTNISIVSNADEFQNLYKQLKDLYKNIK